MTSSASPLLRFELQATGDNLNVWGTKINAAMSRLEDSVAKTNVIALGTAITYDLSAAVKTENYIADESRCAVQQITGTPASAVTITTPNTAKTYVVDNQTTKAVTFVRLGGGTSATVRASQKSLIYCDGSTWTKIGDITLDAVAPPVASVDVNSQKITSLATGTANTDAVNKGQMDSAISAGIWTIAGSVSAGTLVNQFIRWNGTAYEPHEIPVLVSGSGTSVTGTFTAGTMAVNVAGWKVKTADYTAVNNDRIYADSSGGAVNITAPASPTVGDNFSVARDGGSTVTVVRNGSTIAGSAADLTLSATGQVANMICTASNTWKVIGGTLK